MSGMMHARWTTTAVLRRRLRTAGGVQHLQLSKVKVKVKVEAVETAGMVGMAGVTALRRCGGARTSRAAPTVPEMTEVMAAVAASAELAMAEATAAAATAVVAPGSAAPRGVARVVEWGTQTAGEMAEAVTLGAVASGRAALQVLVRGGSMVVVDAVARRAACSEAARSVGEG